MSGNSKNPNAKNPNAKNGNRKKRGSGNSANGNAKNSNGKGNKNPNAKNPNAKSKSKSRNNGNRSSGSGSSGSGKSRGSARKKRRDPMAFWGEMDQLPQPESFDTTPSDTMAVVTSLGDAPIPGQGSSAQHYFQLIYDRASGLAIALGHAGGLDNLTLVEETPEDEAHDGNARDGSEEDSNVSD